MIALQGLAQIADGYDAYIVDLWGVLHDGVTPYPAALDCLAQLRRRGSHITLLSNAPRRAAIAAAALGRMGIEATLYDVIETSGEATYRALASRPDPWFEALGHRVWHLGPPRDRSVFAGLDLRQAASPAQASFVLNTGPDDEHPTDDVAAFDHVLGACRAAGLPMLCANPDLMVHRAGEVLICAGALAQSYTALGGDVRLIGKPDPAIYQPLLPTSASGRKRILAIGDSLRTDIAGAHAVGIDALWVLGGIHAGVDLQAAYAQAANLGIAASFTVPALAW